MGKIIGISGVAGAGKDLFFSIINNKISCKRFALADSLKEESRPHILSLYGIDILNCSREQKNIVRPFLVGAGLTRRKMTNGRYWIEKLEPKIKEFIYNYYCKDANQEPVYPCVTDIRYSEYENDEVGWLKDEMGGVLVHISRFTKQNGRKVFISPANEEERKQDPKLKAKADYMLEWETQTGSKEQITKTLSRGLNDFVSFLEKKT
jgi:hypothetical protein